MTDIPVTLDLLKQMARIADALERLANGGEPTAPDMRRAIEQYKAFDWTSIDAAVVNQDNDGATMVEYAGTLWTRRSPQNKFDPAIWFSRASGGKDADGNVKYLRLITFQTIRDADPLPKKAAEAANKPAQTPPLAVFRDPTPVKEPEKQPEKIEGADRASYVAWATSKTFNLPRETAVWLLDKVSGDIANARKLIPFVAEAKAGGLDGKAVSELLGMAKFDPQEFMVLVRNRTKHGGV